MGTLGVAIGGAAIVGGIKSMVSETMDAIDSTADLSDRLGVSTEMLTGLGHAATMNGSSVEELNDALDTVSKTIGILNEKGGKNAAVLSDMGVDVAKLSALSPDQMFLELADAMNNLGSAQERAALAGMLKLGPDMVNVLMKGRDALEANVQEAKELGIAYSRIDAEKIKQANDAWNRTGAAMRGAGNQAAIAFAPVFEGLAMAAQDAINISKLIGGRDVSATQKGLPKAVGLPTEPERLKLLQDSVRSGRLTAEQAASAGLPGDMMPEGFKSKAMEATEAQNKLNERMAEFVDQLQIQVDMYGKSADAVRLYELQRQGANAADIEAARALIDQKQLKEEQSKAAERARDEEHKRELKDKEDFKRLAESVQTPSEKLRKEFDELSSKASFMRPFGLGGPDDVFTRAFADIERRVKETLPGPVGAQSTAAIRAGSVDALRAQFTGRSVGEKALKEAEKQTREQEAMRDLLEDIRDRTTAMAEAPG